MKTIAALSLVCLCVTSPLLAVVPPSTAMEPDVATTALAPKGKEPLRHSLSALERLEEDTRRLEEVLHDLQEDHQDLMQSTEKKRGFNDQKNP